MQTKQLKRITFDISNGAPELRASAAEAALVALRQDLNRLGEKAQRWCAEFAASLSAETSRHVERALRPVGIEADLRVARLLSVIAWLLTVTELALTFFVALVFGVSAPFLLLVALVAIFALKVGLLALWRNGQQPQQTRQRLRRYVIAPSLVVTMLALFGLVLVRTAGVLALVLLPLINLALGALSIGCLGLAAGLFALSYLLSWSRHAERRFDALEREAVATRRVLQQVERVSAELRAARLEVLAARPAAPGLMTSAPEQPAPQAASRQVVRRYGAGGGLSLLLLAALGGGCKLPTMAAGTGTGNAPAAAPASSGAAPSSTAAEEVRAELWLDWSLSAEAEPYRQATQKLLASLPELIVAHEVAQFTAYQFGAQGWQAAELFSLELPPAQMAARDEAGVFFGQLRAQQDAQASAQRLQQVRAQLATVTPERLLPQTAEPPCTDLQGALERIATMSAARRLVYLLTDGHESCARALRPVKLERVALVIVVLPEETPPAATLRADQIWQQRRDELQQIAPGAVIIPFFGDVRQAAEQALAQWPAQQ